MISSILILRSSLLPFSKASVTPVSYTHLDVYKRQNKSNGNLINHGVNFKAFRERKSVNHKQYTCQNYLCFIIIYFIIKYKMNKRRRIICYGKQKLKSDVKNTEQIIRLRTVYLSKNDLRHLNRYGCWCEQAGNMKQLSEVLKWMQKRRHVLNGGEHLER